MEAAGPDWRRLMKEIGTRAVVRGFRLQRCLSTARRANAEAVPRGALADEALSCLVWQGKQIGGLAVAGNILLAAVHHAVGGVVAETPGGHNRMARAARWLFSAREVARC